MKQFTYRKPTRNKFRKIRSLLRERKEMTAKEISEEIGVSVFYARDLLSKLIAIGQVHIPYTVRCNSSKERYVYALTAQYLATVKSESDADDQAIDKTVGASPARYVGSIEARQRKPWYKRAIAWLTGDSDLRTGA